MDIVDEEEDGDCWDGEDGNEEEVEYFGNFLGTKVALKGGGNGLAAAGETAADALGDAGAHRIWMLNL